MNKQYLALTLVCTVGAHFVYWLLFNMHFEGDELRYLDQATRYLAGDEFYKNSRIVNPPLLPLVVAFLIQIGVPVDLLPLFSILALSFVALVMFKLISPICSPRWACVLSLFITLHPAVLMLGSDIMSEPYTLLAGSIAVYLVIRLETHKRMEFPKLLLLAAVFTSMAMMKPLFGYTLTVALILSAMIAMCLRGSNQYFLMKMSMACLVALFLCLPFLIFTYVETGKIFAWSTGAGTHLYWMSIGGEDIWGSWVPDTSVNQIPHLVDYGYAAEINSTSHMNYPEKDAFLLSIAMQRIAENPEHLIQNIIANAGRVLFNYPYSFRAQSLFTYGYILPNMIVYLSLGLSILLLPITWRDQESSIIWIILFFLIYLGGNILVGSTGRQGLPVLVPVLVWLAHQIRILIKLGYINPHARQSSQSAR